MLLLFSKLLLCLGSAQKTIYNITQRWCNLTCRLLVIVVAVADFRYGSNVMALIGQYLDLALISSL